MYEVAIDNPADMVGDPREIFPSLPSWLVTRRWMGEVQSLAEGGVELLDCSRVSLVDLDVHYFTFRVPGQRSGLSTKVLPLVFVDWLQGRAYPSLLERGFAVTRGDGKPRYLGCEPEYYPPFWRSFFGALSIGLRGLPPPTGGASYVVDGISTRFPALVGSFGAGSATPRLEVLGGGDTTNVVVKLSLAGAEVVVKGYRTARESCREVVLGKYLAEVGFGCVPELLASVELSSHFGKHALYTVSEYVDLEGDAGKEAWDNLVTLSNSASRSRSPGELPVKEHLARVVPSLALVARTIAHFHRALVGPAGSHFEVTPVRRPEIDQWSGEFSEYLGRIRNFLGESRPPKSSVPEVAEAGELLQRLLLKRTHDIPNPFEGASLEGYPAQVVHEDLHLGQVLKVRGSSGARPYVILDLEGDPETTASSGYGEGHEGILKKYPVQKDLAGVVRALSYIKIHAFAQKFFPSPEEGGAGVLWAAIAFLSATGDIEFPGPFARTIQSSGSHAEMIRRAVDSFNAWERGASQVIVDSYLGGGGGGQDRAGEFRGILEVFLVDRVVKEVHYELKYRPSRLAIPAVGLLELTAPASPRPV
ncbi:MAG: hypothetical protein ACTSU5_06545 [Promethearchaeota archaeon]